MTGPKGSIVSTTTTTTSASRLLLLSIHSSTLGVRFSVDYAFFNSCSFILNPPGFECGGKEDTHRGRSEHMCVCISCPLSTAEAVHSAGECESLYLSEMHTNAPAPHYADITPPNCYWWHITHIREAFVVPECLCLVGCTATVAGLLSCLPASVAVHCAVKGISRRTSDFGCQPGRLVSKIGT